MAIDAAISGTSRAPASLTRVVIAATIGNVLEWFDFVVYGFFAVTRSLATVRRRPLYAGC